MREEFIKVDKSKGRVNRHLTMIFYKDQDSVIAYLPSLIISGYGDSEKEAAQMVTTTVEEYFRSLLPQPLSVITNELKQYGWMQKKYLKKQFIPTAFIDPAGILRQFDLPKEAFLKEELLQVTN